MQAPPRLPRPLQMRNMHLALMLSQGTPMILIGGPCKQLCVLCLSQPAGPCVRAQHHPPTLHPPPTPAGDEYGQSRQGNNNYYGHDTKLTHYDWEALEEAKQSGWFRCGPGRCEPPTGPVLNQTV